MVETTIAGSLPKPAWLAKPRMLWAPWQLEGEALAEAKHDAKLLALKEQEDAGIDIVTDGEQARQHFVHGFLEHIEGVDFTRRVTMGIRKNRYNAEVPIVTGPLRRKSNVHSFEAKIARAHTRRRLKFTLPGPMTIVDTTADAHYGDKVTLAMAFAALLNEEARELVEIGVDVVQFDEPAFNVYMKEVTEWVIAALDCAVEDLPCKTAVHICYGYGVKANIDWKSGRFIYEDLNQATERAYRISRGQVIGRRLEEILGTEQAQLPLWYMWACIRTGENQRYTTRWTNDGGDAQIDVMLPVRTNGIPSELGDRDCICISVRDSGTGMTEDVLHSTVEPFFTTKEVGKGSGLGLSQVYGMVQQSNGSLPISDAAHPVADGRHHPPANKRRCRSTPSATSFERITFDPDGRKELFVKILGSP